MMPCELSLMERQFVDTGVAVEDARMTDWTRN